MVAAGGESIDSEVGQMGGADESIPYGQIADSQRAEKVRESDLARGH